MTRAFLLLSFLVAANGLPQPQVPSVDLIQDVFGSSTDEWYQEVTDRSPNVQDTTEDIVGSTGSSDKLVDNVPNDYVEAENENLRETVTVEVVADDADCASYTDTLGYMCVPYYQCSNGTIITDGAGLIDIRNGFGTLNAQDGKCPGVLDVCCKDPNFIPPPPQPQPYQASCGRRNQNGLGVRIQGFKDGESQVGEWPHMCALLREEIVAQKAMEGYDGGDMKSTTLNHFVCGASLIEPGVVLTGAHCVNGFNNNEILKVRCGEWDTQAETEAYTHQDRYVNNFVVHPLFNEQNLFNDYAILFTTADFIMDHNVDSICLPRPGESFVFKDCFATGWGKDKFGKGGEFQVILKEVDLPIVHSYQCEASLRKTRLGDKFRLDDSFLCAGGIPGKDTCKGDGGSPLVCPSKNIPNRYVQAGIVAWGIGCGEQGTPGVYGNVAKGVCFIDHAMSCNGVAVGSSSDSFLGFSHKQCGRWFQNSLPTNLPEGAKDGASLQYLSTQCTVQYIEDLSIGEQSNEVQTNNDVYNNDNRNQAQNSSDVYNDAKSNQGQNSNDVYKDSQANQEQISSGVYNDGQVNEVQINSDVDRDAQINQTQTNNDVYNDAIINQSKTKDDVSNNHQIDQAHTNGDINSDDKKIKAQIVDDVYNYDQSNQIQTINDVFNNSQVNLEQTSTEVYNDYQTDQTQYNTDVHNDGQTNEAQTNSDIYSDAQINQGNSNNDIYSDDQSNQATSNGASSVYSTEQISHNVTNDYVDPKNDVYNNVQTPQTLTNSDVYNHVHSNQGQTNNNDYSYDNEQTSQAQTNTDVYNEGQSKEAQTTTDVYSDAQTNQPGPNKDVYNNYDQTNQAQTNSVPSTSTSEKCIDNVPNDYAEPEDENLSEAVTVEVLADNQDCASYADTLGYMCVPYYQCSNGTIITDGAGLIDIRNGFGTLNAQDGKCPGFLDVCCKDPDFIPPSPQPQPYQASCGRRNKNGLGVRIQGFKEGESQMGEWPHMCALLREEIVREEVADGYEGGEIKSTTITHFVCGASLIEPGVLLTGAHCVNGFKNNEILKVRCGEWDTQTETEAYPHQDRYVNNFVVHPLFNGQNLFNDYAILFTTADFIMDHNVDTICLPQPGETFVSEDCFATGWGKDKFGKGGEYHVILKEINLPVVDSYQCEAILRKTRLGEKFRLDDSFLCAGGIPGKDTCKGDGGSPLVCPSKTIPNRYVQAGIVAWGIGCGEEGIPGVYGDVAKGVCFIDHVMSCNGKSVGDRADSVLGFSQEQCGRWFQGSFPANLPHSAKEGAALQYLNTQCTLNYVEHYYFGDQFPRQEEESYEAQTNQTQRSIDGYNDNQTF